MIVPRHSWSYIEKMYCHVLDPELGFRGRRGGQGALMGRSPFTSVPSVQSTEVKGSLFSLVADSCALSSSACSALFMHKQ